MVHIYPLSKASVPISPETAWGPTSGTDPEPLTLRKRRPWPSWKDTAAGKPEETRPESLDFLKALGTKCSNIPIISNACADPKSRSTLPFSGLHHRSPDLGAFYLLDPSSGLGSRSGSKTISTVGFGTCTPTRSNSA